MKRKLQDDQKVTVECNTCGRDMKVSAALKLMLEKQQAQSITFEFGGSVTTSLDNFPQMTRHPSSRQDLEF